MQPLVGIPLLLEARQRFRRGRTTYYADVCYAGAVERAGGLPVQIPPQRDAAGVAARLDAVLFPGGDDFAPPSPYPPDVRFELVPEAQLAFDRALLRAALERRIPVLGICYGMQLIASELGGQLLYHVPLDLPGAGAHQLPDAGDRHPVHVEPDSRLAGWIGAGTHRVNSSHHQGVGEPGPQLRVSARADDGLVEAVELPSVPFCAGVQWHPERLDDSASLALFAALVSAAG